MTECECAFSLFTQAQRRILSECEEMSQNVGGKGKKVHYDIHRAVKNVAKMVTRRIGRRPSSIEVHHRHRSVPLWLGLPFGAVSFLQQATNATIENCEHAHCHSCDGYGGRGGALPGCCAATILVTSS